MDLDIHVGEGQRGALHVARSDGREEGDDHFDGAGDVEGEDAAGGGVGEGGLLGEEVGVVGGTEPDVANAIDADETSPSSDLAAGRDEYMDFTRCGGP